MPATQSSAQRAEGHEEPNFASNTSSIAIERGTKGEEQTRNVTHRQMCPPPNGIRHNLRSKTRWFTGFCNSHQVSHFATFFIDARAQISVVESHPILHNMTMDPNLKSNARGKGIVIFGNLFVLDTRLCRSSLVFQPRPTC